MPLEIDGHAQPAEANRNALDWLNFFLANVKDGVGPFLAIFLMSSQHWDAGSIGIALTVGGVATVLARGPAGALVDAVHWKRTLILVSAIAVAAAPILMAIYPRFWPVAALQTVNGVADSIFPLAITAISLASSDAKTSPPASAVTKPEIMREMSPPPSRLASWVILSPRARSYG